MSTSIKKSGVISASKVLGSNIIPGTSANEVQYSYPAASTYSDRFSATTNIIPSASQYTLSFYAKSTVAGDKVRAHYYSPNTTTKAQSSQGVTTTSSDGNIDFTLSTNWEKYWVTYTQNATTAVKHVIFPRMFGIDRTEAAKGTGTVSIKCLKLEEGAHPTPWIAADTETTKYVGAVHGFVESETDFVKLYDNCIESNQFYEM